MGGEQTRAGDGGAGGRGSAAGGSGGGGAGVTLIDTRDTPWADPAPGEAFHATGVLVKVLARAPEGWPQAQLLWVPPGLKSINPHGQAERHYHTTVREWVYVLEGEHPYREYAHIDSKEWDPLLWRAGFFLDRLPGPTSVHGTDPGKSRLHGVCLEIRDGKSTAPGETGYLTENVSITDDDLAGGVPIAQPPAGARVRTPFAPLSGPGIARSTATVRWYDTRALPWQEPAAGAPLAGVAGARLKPLSTTDAGEPLFEIGYLPPGAVDGAPPRYSFVLEGSLSTPAGDAGRGTFLENTAAAPTEAGTTGCVALRWRDGS